jgi:hypothetical protein
MDEESHEIRRRAAGALGEALLADEFDFSRNGGRDSA